jgi:hypothetical protein
MPAGTQEFGHDPNSTKRHFPPRQMTESPFPPISVAGHVRNKTLLSVGSTAPRWRDAWFALVLLSALYVVLAALASYGLGVTSWVSCARELRLARCRLARWIAWSCGMGTRHLADCSDRICHCPVADPSCGAGQRSGWAVHVRYGAMQTYFLLGRAR